MTSNGADAEGMSDPPRVARTGSWVALALVLLAAALVGGLVGAVVGYGVAKRRPSSYEGIVTVRSPVVDGSCVYFNCPSPSPGPNGIAYVANQAQQIPTSGVAEQVTRSAGGNLPPVSELVANVKAAEIGTSNSIAISYTSPSATQARQLAADFAAGYVQWSNNQAITSINSVVRVLKRQQDKATKPSVQLADAIGQLQAAAATFAQGTGPNGASDFGLTPSGVVVKRTGLSPGRSAGIGALVGSVLGVLIMLLILGRSSGKPPLVSAAPREPRARSAQPETSRP